MENPMTWGEPEKVIQDAYRQWSEARDKGVVGLSLAKTISNALRNAGLLNEDA
jgi:hypothetical protein